jgi:hypothetical protein
MKCAVFLDCLCVIFRINKENSEYWKSQGIVFPQYLPVRSDQLEFSKISRLLETRKTESYELSMLNPFLGTDYGIASTCVWDIYIAYIIPGHKLFTTQEIKDLIKNSLVGGDNETSLDSTFFTVKSVIKEIHKAIELLYEVHLFEYTIYLYHILIAFYEVYKKNFFLIVIRIFRVLMT